MAHAIHNLKSCPGNRSGRIYSAFHRHQWVISAVNNERGRLHKGKAVFSAARSKDSCQLPCVSCRVHPSPIGLLAESGRPGLINGEAWPAENPPNILKVLNEGLPARGYRPEEHLEHLLHRRRKQRVTCGGHDGCKRLDSLRIMHCNFLADHTTHGHTDYVGILDL